jgi:hypothetical protein
MEAIVARRARFDNRLPQTPVDSANSSRENFKPHGTARNAKRLVFNKIGDYFHFRHFDLPRATSSHMLASHDMAVRHVDLAAPKLSQLHKQEQGLCGSNLDPLKK